MYHRATSLSIATVALALLATACNGESNKDAETTGKAVSSAPTTPATPPAPPNGIEKLGAKQILRKAEAATRAAKSVRVSAELKEGRKTIRMELWVSEQAGTARVGRTGEGSVEVIRLGEVVYTKADETMLRSTGGQAYVTLMAGKYLKASAKDKEVSEHAVLTRLSAVDEFFSEEEPKNAVARTDGVVREINGVRVVVVTTSDGEVQVAAQGPPYVLRVDGKDGKNSGFVAYSGYGKQVTAQPPPTEQVVDVAQLRQGQ